MSFRSTFRGWIGERAASLGMRMFLNNNIYRSIHDIILPTGNGTTQIDHIVVSRFGIFVIETKNMSGWIFGRETDTHWTQVLFRNKYRFQNPLRQNYCHTKSLADFLALDHSLFHSIVFFIGDCQFKTAVPKAVISSGLLSYIKQFTQPCLNDMRVGEVVDTLNALKANPRLSRQTHLANVRERHKTV
jgi:restriction system protein